MGFAQSIHSKSGFILQVFVEHLLFALYCAWCWDTMKKKREVMVFSMERVIWELKSYWLHNHANDTSTNCGKWQEEKAPGVPGVYTGEASVDGGRFPWRRDWVWTCIGRAACANAWRQKEVDYVRGTWGRQCAWLCRPRGREEGPRAFGAWVAMRENPASIPGWEKQGRNSEEKS